MSQSSIRTEISLISVLILDWLKKGIRRIILRDEAIRYLSTDDSVIADALVMA